MISVTVTPFEKEYLKSNFISPTKLLKKAIADHKNDNNVSEFELQLKQDIKHMQKHYNDSLKPNADNQIYIKAIELFLKKYPNWTKSEIVARAEKTRRDLISFEFDEDKLI